MGAPQLILCHFGILPIFLAYFLPLYQSLIYANDLPLNPWKGLRDFEKNARKVKIT